MAVVGSASQRVGGALAGEAGVARGISMSSNCVRSLVKPALHVGEHTVGGLGWRAAWGNGRGSAGASTGEGKLLAQPLTSITSAISIRRSGLFTFGGILRLLLKRRSVAALFVALGLHRRGQSRGVAGAQFGYLAAHAPSLHIPRHGAASKRGADNGSGEQVGLHPPQPSRRSSVLPCCRSMEWVICFVRLFTPGR